MPRPLTAANDSAPAGSHVVEREGSVVHLRGAFANVLSNHAWLTQQEAGHGMYHLYLTSGQAMKRATRASSPFLK